MKQQAKFKQTEIGEIPRGWNVEKIENVAEVIGGGTPSTKNGEYWSGKISWLTPKDLSNYNSVYISKGERSISEKGLKNSSAKLVPKGTVLLTSRAPIGYLAIADEEMTTNQGFRSLIPKKDKTTSEFLYYLLKSKVDYLKSQAYGSTFGEISGTTVKNLEFKFPSLPEQKAIAKILSELDFKMEVNRQMNNTLEAMGKALFKRWFIDFEFPNEESKPYKSSGGEMVESEMGKIPKGWEIKALGEVSDFYRGFSYRGSEKFTEPSDYIFITLNSVKEGGGFKPEYAWIKSDRLKENNFVNELDLIIANTEQTKDGTLLAFPAILYFNKDYRKDRAVFSHHITKVSTHSKNLKYFLYYFLHLTQQKSVAFHTGSVIWALDVNNFKKHRKIILPPNKLIELFHNFCQESYLKISKNQKEIETLKGIRDSILPKLMSGKIRVPIENGR